MVFIVTAIVEMVLGIANLNAIAGVVDNVQRQRGNTSIPQGATSFKPASEAISTSDAKAVIDAAGTRPNDQINAALVGKVGKGKAINFIGKNPVRSA